MQVVHFPVAKVPSAKAKSAYDVARAVSFDGLQIKVGGWHCSCEKHPPKGYEICGHANNTDRAIRGLSPSRKVILLDTAPARCIIEYMRAEHAANQAKLASAQKQGMAVVYIGKEIEKAAKSAAPTPASAPVKPPPPAKPPPAVKPVTPPVKPVTPTAQPKSDFGQSRMIEFIELD